MFEKLVANLLASKLGRFIEDLNTDSVKVSLWRGNVVLKNVKLRRSALRDLGLPVYVESGEVETLTVVIPWSRLRSESVKVELDNMKVRVKSRRPEDWNSEADIVEAHRSKMEKLDAAESSLNERILKAVSKEMNAENNSSSTAENNKDSASGGSTLERWQLTMANNLHVAITRVSVSFIDDFSSSIEEKIFTLSIKQLFIQSCADDTWKPAFIERVSDDLRKLITLGGCSLSYSTSLKTSSSSSSLTSNNSQKQKAVLNPFDLTIRAKQSLVESKSTWSVQVLLSTLGGILTRTQFDAARTIFRFVSSVDDRAAFLVHRPSCRILSTSSASSSSPTKLYQQQQQHKNPNAVLWWKYAINAVLTVLRRRSGTRKSRWNLDIYYLQKEYIGLYRRAIGTAASSSSQQQLQQQQQQKNQPSSSSTAVGLRVAASFLQPLSKDEKKRLIKLELELPVETLVYARKVAIQRLTQEEGYIKAKRAGSSDPIASAVREFENSRDQEQQRQNAAEAGGASYVKTAGRSVVAAGSAAGTVAYSAAAGIARAGTGVVSWMFGYSAAQQKEDLASRQIHDDGLSVEERLLAEELATTSAMIPSAGNENKNNQSSSSSSSSQSQQSQQQQALFSEEEAREVAELSEKLGSGEWQEQQRKLLNDMFGEADSVPVATTTRFHVSIDIEEIHLDLADESEHASSSSSSFSSSSSPSSSYSSFAISQLRTLVKHDQSAKTWDVNFTILDMGITSESEDLSVLKTENLAATKNFLSLQYNSIPVDSLSKKKQQITDDEAVSDATIVEKTKSSCNVKLEPFELSIAIPWMRRSYAFWQDDVDSIGAVASVVSHSQNAVDSNDNNNDNNNNNNGADDQNRNQKQQKENTTAPAEFRLAEYFAKNPRITTYNIELERVVINVIDRFVPPVSASATRANPSSSSFSHQQQQQHYLLADELLSRTASETSTRITYNKLSVENDAVALMHAMERVSRSPSSALREDWSEHWRAKVEFLSVDVFWNEFRSLSTSASGSGPSSSTSSSTFFTRRNSNTNMFHSSSSASTSAAEIPTRSCTLLSDFPLVINLRLAHLAPALMPPLLRLAGTQCDVTFPRGEFIFDASEPLALAAFMNSVTLLLDFSGDSRGLRAVERASKKAMMKQKQQQQEQQQSVSNIDNNKSFTSAALAKSFLALDEMNAVVLQCRGPFEGLWEGPSSSPTLFSFDTFEPWTTNATPAPASSTTESATLKKKQQDFVLRSVHARYGDISIMHDSRPTYPMMKTSLKKNQFLTSVHPVNIPGSPNNSNWGTSLLLLRGGVAQPPNISRDVQLAKATLDQYGIPPLPSVEQLRRCVEKVCEKLDAESAQVSDIQKKLEEYGEEDPVPDALMASSIIAQQLRGALKVVEIAGDIVPAQCVTFLHSSKHDAEAFQHLLDRVALESPPVPPKIPPQLLSTVTMRMSMHTDKKFALRVRRPHFDPLSPPPSSANNFTEGAPFFFETSGSTTISYESTWSSTEFSLKTAEIQMFSQTPPGALNNNNNNNNPASSLANQSMTSLPNSSMTSQETNTNNNASSSTSQQQQESKTHVIPPSYTNPLPVVQFGGKPANASTGAASPSSSSRYHHQNNQTSSSSSPSTTRHRDVLSSTSAGDTLRVPIRLASVITKNSSDMSLSCSSQTQSKIRIDPTACGMFETMLDVASTMLSWSLAVQQVQCKAWTSDKPTVSASHVEDLSGEYKNNNDSNDETDSKDDEKDEESNRKSTHPLYASNLLFDFTSGIELEMFHDARALVGISSAKLNAMMMNEASKMQSSKFSATSSSSSSSIHPSLAKFVCSKLVGKWRMTEILNMTSINAQNPTLALTGKQGVAFLSPHPSTITGSPTTATASSSPQQQQVPLGVSSSPINPRTMNYNSHSSAYRSSNMNNNNNNNNIPFANSTLEFTFDIHYRPSTMSYNSWLSSGVLGSATSGFAFSYSLGLHLTRCCCTYRQTYLWDLLEYSGSSPVVKRMTWLTARKPLDVHDRYLKPQQQQQSFSSSSTSNSNSGTSTNDSSKKPPFYHLMTQQQIKLVDTVLFVSENEEGVHSPVFCVHVPLMEIGSDLFPHVRRRDCDETAKNTSDQNNNHSSSASTSPPRHQQHHHNHQRYFVPPSLPFPFYGSMTKNSGLPANNAEQEVFEQEFENDKGDPVSTLTIRCRNLRVFEVGNYARTKNVAKDRDQEQEKKKNKREKQKRKDRRSSSGPASLSNTFGSLSATQTAEAMMAGSPMLKRNTIEKQSDEAHGFHYLNLNSNNKNNTQHQVHFDDDDYSDEDSTTTTSYSDSDSEDDNFNNNESFAYPRHTFPQMSNNLHMLYGEESEEVSYHRHKSKSSSSINNHHHNNNDSSSSPDDNSTNNAYHKILYHTPKWIFHQPQNWTPIVDMAEVRVTNYYTLAPMLLDLPLSWMAVDLPHFVSESSSAGLASFLQVMHGIFYEKWRASYTVASYAENPYLGVLRTLRLPVLANTSRTRSPGREHDVLPEADSCRKRTGLSREMYSQLLPAHDTASYCFNFGNIFLCIHDEDDDDLTTAPLPLTFNASDLTIALQWTSRGVTLTQTKIGGEVCVGFVNSKQHGMPSFEEFAASRYSQQQQSSSQNKSPLLRAAGSTSIGNNNYNFSGSLLSSSGGVNNNNNNNTSNNTFDQRRLKSEYQQQLIIHHEQRTFLSRKYPTKWMKVRERRSEGIPDEESRLFTSHHLQIDYSWSPVYGVHASYSLGIARINLLVDRLVDTKDTLLSLKMRNAFGRFLNWPDYVPGETEEQKEMEKKQQKVMKEESFRDQYSSSQSRSASQHAKRKMAEEEKQEKRKKKQQQEEAAASSSSSTVNYQTIQIVNVAELQLCVFEKAHSASYYKMMKAKKDKKEQEEAARRRNPLESFGEDINDDVPILNSPPAKFNTSTNRSRSNSSFARNRSSSMFNNINNNQDILYDTNKPLVEASLVNFSLDQYYAPRSNVADMVVALDSISLFAYEKPPMEFSFSPSSSSPSSSNNASQTMKKLLKPAMDQMPSGVTPLVIDLTLSQEKARQDFQNVENNNTTPTSPFSSPRSPFSSSSFHQRRSSSIHLFHERSKSDPYYYTVPPSRRNSTTTTQSNNQNNHHRSASSHQNSPRSSSTKKQKQPLPSSSAFADDDELDENNNPIFRGPSFEETLSRSDSCVMFVKFTAKTGVYFIEAKNIWVIAPSLPVLQKLKNAMTEIQSTDLLWIGEHREERHFKKRKNNNNGKTKQSTTGESSSNKRRSSSSMKQQHRRHSPTDEITASSSTKRSHSSSSKSKRSHSTTSNRSPQQQQQLLKSSSGRAGISFDDDTFAGDELAASLAKTLKESTQRYTEQKEQERLAEIEKKKKQRKLEKGQKKKQKQLYGDDCFGELSGFVSDVESHSDDDDDDDTSGNNTTVRSSPNNTISTTTQKLEQEQEEHLLQSKPPKLLYDFSLPNLGVVVTEDGDWDMAAVLMTGSVCSFQVEEVYYRLSDEEYEEKKMAELEKIASSSSLRNSRRASPVTSRHGSFKFSASSANQNMTAMRRSSSNVTNKPQQQQQQESSSFVLDDQNEGSVNLAHPMQRSSTALPTSMSNDLLLVGGQQQQQQDSSPPLSKHNEDSGIMFFDNNNNESTPPPPDQQNNNNNKSTTKSRHHHHHRSSLTSTARNSPYENLSRKSSSNSVVSPFIKGSRYSVSVIGMFVKMLNTDQVVVDPVSASLRVTMFEKRQLEVAAQVHKIAVTVDRGHYETLLRVIVRNFIKDEKALVEEHANRRQTGIVESRGSPSPRANDDNNNNHDFLSSSTSASSPYGSSSIFSPQRGQQPTKKSSIHLSRGGVASMMNKNKNKNTIEDSQDLDQTFLSPDQQILAERARHEKQQEQFNHLVEIDDDDDENSKKGYDNMEVSVDLSGLQFNIVVENDCVVEMKLGGMSAKMTQKMIEEEQEQEGKDQLNETTKITINKADDDDLEKTILNVDGDQEDQQESSINTKLRKSNQRRKDLLAKRRKTITQMQLQGSLEELLLGLRHRRALFELQAVKEQPISFQTSFIENKERIITGSLGMASMWLDPVTVEIVTNFLYEPYRRIILPKYGVTDLLQIEDDVKLDEALILTKRQLVRISSEKKNYIRIDCQGHAIHFLPTLSPVILLDSGCTLELYNGKVFLYSGVKSVDAAVSGGNGSYTILNRIEVIAADDNDGGDGIDTSQQRQQQQQQQQQHGTSTSSSSNNMKSSSSIPQEVQRNLESARRRKIKETNHIAVGLSIALPDYAGLRELCLSVGVILSREVTPLRLSNDEILARHPSSSSLSLSSSNHNYDVSTLEEFLETTTVSKVSAKFENFQASCRYYEVVSDHHHNHNHNHHRNSASHNKNDNNIFKQYYSYKLREIDFSSLITPWSFKLIIDNTLTKQILVMSADRGMDLRLRCGDVAVVVDAMDSATQAIRSVEESVGSSDPNLAAAQAFLSNRRKRRVDDDDTTTETTATTSRRPRRNTTSVENSGGEHRSAGNGSTNLKNNDNANDDDDEDLGFSGIVAPTRSSKATKILISFPQLGIYLVDDSSSIDMPLVYFSVFNVTAPTFDLLPTGTQVGHIQLKLQVEHYSGEAGLWQPLIEKVPVDFAFRETAPEPDSSDDSKNEPSKRAGLNFGTVHMHLTPPAIEMCLRASNVFTKVLATGTGAGDLGQQQSTSSQRSKNSGGKNSSAFVDPLDPRIQKKKEADRNNKIAQNSSMAIAILERHRRILQKQQQIQKQRLIIQQQQQQQSSSKTSSSSSSPTAALFRQYEIRQNLGHLAVTISFADDAQSRFPKPFTLRFGQTHAFNYPRIDGQEIPIRQHMILVTVESSRSIPIFIGSVGESSFQLPPGSPCSNVVVDIFLQNAQKIVELRLPIKFENELPFPVQLGGVVGSDPRDSLLEPNSTKHLTAEPLRRRCVFRPIIDGVECGAAHLGLHYEDLHFLFGQVFLASFPIHGFTGEESASASSPSPSKNVSSEASGGIMFGNDDGDQQQQNSNSNNKNSSTVKSFLASGEMSAQRAVYALIVFSPLRMIPNVGGPVSISTGLEDLPSPAPILPPSSASTYQQPASILQQPLSTLKQAQQQLELQRAKTSLNSNTSYATSSLDVSDITVTLQPPFYIQNHTGVPIKVGLYYHQQFVGRQDQQMKVDSGFSFAHIVSLPIEVEQTTPITQVSPLHNVYLDVMLTQPTGEVLSRTSSQPALVRCQDASQRASTLTIHDQKGQPLTLLIDYKSRLIVLRAPFWIINHTMHYLQLQFPSLLSTTPCAGVGAEGVPPMSKQPFLVGGAADAASSSLLGLVTGLGKDDYEKRQKMRSKWKIQAKIGRYENPTSGIVWSKWSEPVGLGAVIDIGDIVCPLERVQEDGSDAVSLSFSNHLVGGVIQDTMVMTFRARWIVLNRSNFDLSLFRGYASTDGEFQTFQSSNSKKKQQQQQENNDKNDDDDQQQQQQHQKDKNWQYNDQKNESEPFAALRPQSSVAIELCRRAKINANCIKIQCTTNSYYASKNSSSSVENKVSPFDSIGSGSTSQNIIESEKSPTIPIDHISEYNLNIRYIKIRQSDLAMMKKKTENNHQQNQQSQQQKIREFVVFRVSIYTRTSVMFVVIDEMKNPPFQVENRTPFLVCVKQESSLQELLLYPFSTRGFVWEKEYEPHVLELDLVIARNRVAQTVLDLDPLLVVRRTMRQLKKEISIPGSQQRVFVRTRAKKDTFCISLTLDRRIDSMLTRPFAQLRFDLVFQGLFVLIADTESDQRRNIALLSLPEVFASFAQGRLAEQGAPPEDVQKIELSFGSLQLEKWNEDASSSSSWGNRTSSNSNNETDENGFTNVQQTDIILSMLASQSIKKNSLVILRRKDRSVPVLHIRYLAVILQPLLVTVDDPFLEDVLSLVDRVNSAVEAASNATNNNNNNGATAFGPSGDLINSQIGSSSPSITAAAAASVSSTTGSSMVLPPAFMKLPNKKILEVEDELKQLNNNNNEQHQQHHKRTRSMIIANASHQQSSRTTSARNQNDDDDGDNPTSTTTQTGLVSSVPRHRTGSQFQTTSSSNFHQTSNQQQQQQQAYDYSTLISTPITSSIFETTPWSSEISAKSAEESDFMFKTVVIDSMLLEQFVASVTLVRGTDSSGRDPIKERLGTLSVLVQSVDDARFDFHRIQKQNIYGKIWLLGTQLGHYYLARLKNQALNVVHIAVLDDLMRDVVNDLLDGYFTSAKVNIDRSRDIPSRRKDTRFQFGVDNSADAEALLMMKKSSGLSQDEALVDSSSKHHHPTTSSRTSAESLMIERHQQQQQAAAASRSSSLKTHLSQQQQSQYQRSPGTSTLDDGGGGGGSESTTGMMSYQRTTSSSLSEGDFKPASAAAAPTPPTPIQQQQQSGPRVVQTDRGFIIFPDLSKGIPLFVTDKESVGIFRKFTRFVRGQSNNSTNNSNNNNANNKKSKNPKESSSANSTKPIFCRCKLVSSALKKGQFPKESHGSAWIRLEELCHHSSWEELIQLLPSKELRVYGLLIAQLHARWRPLTVFTGISNSLVGPVNFQHHNNTVVMSPTLAMRNQNHQDFNAKNRNELAADEAGFGCSRCAEIEELRQRKLSDALSSLNAALELQKQLVVTLKQLRKDENMLHVKLREQFEKEEEIVAIMKEENERMRSENGEDDYYPHQRQLSSGTFDSSSSSSSASSSSHSDSTTSASTYESSSIGGSMRRRRRGRRSHPETINNNNNNKHHQRVFSTELGIFDGNTSGQHHHLDEERNYSKRHSRQTSSLSPSSLLRENALPTEVKMSRIHLIQEQEELYQKQDELEHAIEEAKRRIVIIFHQVRIIEAPLPHPTKTSLLSWEELCHHASWQEFVSMTNDTELRRYGSLVQQALLGLPRNVTRIEKGLLWAVDS